MKLIFLSWQKLEKEMFSFFLPFLIKVKVHPDFWMPHLENQVKVYTTPGGFAFKL